MQVLHLLMLKLTGRPLNETLFAFLNLDERLVDMGDDLVDYEVLIGRAKHVAAAVLQRLSHLLG